MYIPPRHYLYVLSLCTFFFKLSGGMASQRLNLARAAMAEAVARELVEGDGSIYCCSSWAFCRGAAHLAAPRWPSRSLDSRFRLLLVMGVLPWCGSAGGTSPAKPLPRFRSPDRRMAVPDRTPRRYPPRRRHVARGAALLAASRWPSRCLDAGSRIELRGAWLCWRQLAGKRRW